MSNKKSSGNSKNYEQFNICAFFLYLCDVIYQIQVECDHKSNNNQIKSNYNPDLFTDLFLITFTKCSGERAVDISCFCSFTYTPQSTTQYSQ